MVYLNIEYLLKKKGKKPYWLVQELNSNYTMINKMINNETTRIEFQMISKLLKLFDCTLDELFIVKK